MTTPAIRTVGLSKQYRVGQRQPYGRLSEALYNLARSSRRHRSRTKEQDLIWALKDVSLEVDEGEVVGLIGRNGGGKSTLLKILSRITEPTEGYAELRGRLGSLLEVGTGFHPELTGRENVYLKGAVIGMRKREVDRKFDEIVAFSEVEKYLDTPVKRYSTGMQLRLAFAVASHLEADILAVDEVLAVGDIQFREKCLRKMESVASEGSTILFVGHHMGQIRRLCKRVVWLDGGRIRASGDTEFVVSRYEHASRVDR
jgi:homopolymeric O-antigen transport system ATP-binding protein